MHTNRNVRVLQGHTDWINNVAFSPDGKQIASCSDDTTVRLWSVAKDSSDGRPGRCVQVLQGHTDWVNCVAWSPDIRNKQFASGSNDNTVRLWAIASDGSGQSVAVLRGHTCAVFSVAFSLDSKLLVSGSDDHTVRLWFVVGERSGECVRVLHGHANSVSSVAFSPDIRTKQIVSGSSDGTVRLWTLCKWTPRTHHLFSHEVRDEIFQLMCVRGSEPQLLPTELWFLIFETLAA